MKNSVLLLIAGGVIAAVSAVAFKANTGDFTRADVDRIAADCNVPASKMILKRGWITVIEPVEHDLASMCMMQALRQSGKKSIQIVANQLHTSDDHQ